VLGGIGHYKLAPDSPLLSAGLDGVDIGCNLRRVWGREEVARLGSEEDD
jgi:hypothetical protein